MYFRFYGWRHVWSLWAVWRERHCDTGTESDVYECLVFSAFQMPQCLVFSVIVHMWLKKLFIQLQILLRCQSAYDSEKKTCLCSLDHSYTLPVFYCNMYKNSFSCDVYPVYCKFFSSVQFPTYIRVYRNILVLCFCIACVFVLVVMRPAPLKTMPGGILHSVLSVCVWVRLCVPKNCEYHISQTTEDNFTQFSSQMYLIWRCGD